MPQPENRETAGARPVRSATDTRAQLREAAARGPQGVCPSCQAPLETHEWWAGAVDDGRRYLVHWCDPAPKKPDPKWLGGERRRA